MSQSIALDYQEVSKAFGSNVVLDGLNLQLRYGELMGVFGRSGEGKSVLLRLAVGLEIPDSGRIMFEGRNLAELREHEFYGVRCNISYVFQNGALFDSMTVAENLAFPLRLHTGRTEEQIRTVVNERLALVGLTGTNELLPQQLSGGMQKRVGLLRATMLDPKITLFDEPTAGLDPGSVRTFTQNMLQMKHRGELTGLFVTHDIPCAFAVCDRIAILRDGRIYALDTVEGIRRSTDPVILSYIDLNYAHPYPGGDDAQANAAST